MGRNGLGQAGRAWRAARAGRDVGGRVGRGRYDALVSPTLLAASGVDWSEIHAVRLLGLALAFLILIWAIRRMFGGKK